MAVSDRLFQRISDADDDFIRTYDNNVFTVLERMNIGRTGTLEDRVDDALNEASRELLLDLEFIWYPEYVDRVWQTVSPYKSIPEGVVSDFDPTKLKLILLRRLETFRMLMIVYQNAMTISVNLNSPDEMNFKKWEKMYYNEWQRVKAGSWFYDVDGDGVIEKTEEDPDIDANALGYGDTRSL